MKIEEIDYNGWKSIRLSNTLCDIVAPLEVGIRIIRFGMVEGENVFFEKPSDAGRKGGEEWRLYGGHRLWFAPEDSLCYQADNAPISYEKTADGFILKQKPEPLTEITKQIQVSMAENKAELSVIHTINVPDSVRSSNQQSMWAITALKAGGTAELSIPRISESHLNPSCSVSLWPYTDLADARLIPGKESIRIQQATGKNPLKIGLGNYSGLTRMSYRLPGIRFVKSFTPVPGNYPDLNSQVQCYTDGAMLELETLGALQMFQGGAIAAHSETWTLEKT